MKSLACVSTLALLSLVSAELNPFSDEFIDLINKKQTTWKAGRNFHPDTPISIIRKLGGVHSDNTIHKLLERPHIKDKGDIPESFDARTAWPKCAKIIGDIRDQGACGASYAFAAVEAMSDRICIHSNATIQVSLSAEDVLTCCFECGQGCQGGNLFKPWDLWATRGIVTGGGYESNVGCRPYSIKPCNHYVGDIDNQCNKIVNTPPCITHCADGYNKLYIDDLFVGHSLIFARGVELMQLEILQNGPIACTFDAYEDFTAYKSGIYQHVEGRYLDRYVIKILGWGIENGTPFWLVANSWNTNWGDSGYFKILRGDDHCGIESSCSAGLPVFN